MQKRWKATVIYKLHHMVTQTILFNEYSELGLEIERGPDWRLIDVISITLNQ